MQRLPLGDTLFRAFCLTKSMGSPNVSLLSDVSCSYIPRRHYFPIALLCEKSPFHSRLPLLLPARRVPLSSPLFLAALEVALVRLRTPKTKMGLFACLSVRGCKFFNRFRPLWLLVTFTTYTLGATLSSARIITSVCTFPISQG